MRRIFAGLAVMAASFGLASLPLRADNRTASKGPDEDGTKPALTRIAGEGMMNSHAFGFLTELSDDVGGRVTGSPAERKAEEWGAAKMQEGRKAKWWPSTCSTSRTKSNISRG